MFASFTHVLTMIAFAAHVFAGCCAHHAHAQNVVLHSEHEAGETTKVSAASCTHGHSPTGASVEVRSGPQQPCHHEGGCDEQSCSFVLAKSIDLAQQPMLNLPALLPLKLMSKSPSLAASGAAGERDSLTLSTAQHCAVLQVWQI